MNSTDFFILTAHAYNGIIDKFTVYEEMKKIEQNTSDGSAPARLNI